MGLTERQRLREKLRLRETGKKKEYMYEEKERSIDRHGDRQIEKDRDRETEIRKTEVERKR